MRRPLHLPESPAELAGGRYELREPLGWGGMAVVHRALDRWSGREVALKLLLPQTAKSEKTRKRFLAEARTMAVLDHPNVVRVLDVGAEDGHFFFVMELGAGGSLSDYLRRFGARPVRESLGYVLQVLRGLDYAHASGVVHRDIKPHNMLLAVEPDPERDAAATLTAPTQTVKLTDFGIARHIATAIDGPRLTGTGDTLGTLAYMSPEQRTDPRNVGPESDLYGVGATLYILLTGRRPFDLAMIDSDRSVMERLPPALRPLVRRATATRPQDRHPSARAMAEDVVAAWEAVGGDAGDAVGALAGFAVEGSDTLVAPLGDGTGFDGDTSGD